MAVSSGIDDTSSEDAAELSSGAPRKRWSLHAKVLLGLVVGATLGILANLMVERGLLSEAHLDGLITYVTRPVGQIFLNMLFMVVVPIVFCSLSLGVARLGRVGRLGRLSFQTFACFLGMTAISSMLGLALVNLVRPGEGFDAAAQAALVEAFQDEVSNRVATGTTGLSIDLFVGIVSRNPIRDAAETKMLPIIFFAGLFGAALTSIRRPLARATMRVVEGVGEVMVTIVGYAMKLAPYAVPALVFNVTARLGFDIVRQLGLFVVLVFCGYVLHTVLTYGALLWIGCRYSPFAFFRRVVPVMVTAFSTSSSNATLPTSIKHTEQDLGVPPHIAGFVLPLGATTNMNGTSLFEAVVVLFLAQVFGIELSIGTQAVVVVLAVLTSIGAAGVPGGSIPLLVGVLETVGIPGEGIAIIIGVDRLLDMGRTVVNVTGDVAAACFVTKRQGFELKTD